MMCNCSACSDLRKWKQREDEMLAAVTRVSRVFSTTEQDYDDALRIKKPELAGACEPSPLEQNYIDAVRKLSEVRKELDEALSKNETFRNKLVFSETIFRRVNTENADLREGLAQQNLEFQNLMAAYKALLDSQKHLIGALE